MLSYSLRAVFLVVISLMHQLTVAEKFSLSDQYVGKEFFNSFTWDTFEDPTHGRVNYVSKSYALTNNLTYASDDKFIMRADSWSVVAPQAPGRMSSRVTSVKAYGDSVIVLDLQHMPQGCSTWPAFWTCSQRGPWPTGGEIDIIEGVNLQSKNLATLHTTGDCSMPKSRDMSGSTSSSNCDANVDYNTGCGVSFSEDNSYGAGFNNGGGGWYVMKRTSADGVWVWFWSRCDKTVPGVVKYGGSNLSPDDSWGRPSARFVTDQCDMEAHFDEHSIIFDLTFCGDWAGSAFATSSCSPQTCNDCTCASITA